MATFRVMTFNVLFGGEDRIDAILDVVADARPDVVVLQECLGWEEGDRLERLARVVGHASLGRARPRGSGACYHLAIGSRAPIEGLELHADPRFVGHCIARFAVARGDHRVVVYGAHFDSHHENLRFVEARYLRSIVDADTFGSDLAILLGDLNSLCRHDPYPVDLGERLIAAGTDKFGHPPRFEVIDELEAFGWIDALRRAPRNERWVTAERDRGGVRIDYRTDYVFLCPRMAERLEGAEVLDAAGCSDHHPVIADLDL